MLPVQRVVVLACGACNYAARARGMPVPCLLFSQFPKDVTRPPSTLPAAHTGSATGMRPMLRACSQCYRHASNASGMWPMQRACGQCYGYMLSMHRT